MPIHKRSRLLLLICLAALVAFVAILVLEVPISNVLTLGLVLLCPLSHLLMHGMGHARGEQHSQDDETHCHAPAPTTER